MYSYTDGPKIDFQRHWQSTDWFMQFYSILFYFSLFRNNNIKFYELHGTDWSYSKNIFTRL